MSITRVWIEEDCTSCGLCESECPEVFELDDIAVVNNNANFLEFEEEIIEAAENCPVEVIKYE